MAQIQTSDGVGSVQPDTTGPDNTLRISASPNAFGAQIGGAEERVGQGLQQVSDSAWNVGKFWGEIQTDDALNNAMGDVNGILDKFRSLQGRDALEAQAQTQTDIAAAFNGARNGLKLPAQKLAFDQSARTYQNRYVSGLIASHADQQSKAVASEVAKAKLGVALTGVANVAEDDQHVEAFAEDARQAMVQQVISQGNGHVPELVQDAADRANQAVYKTQIQTVAINNPQRALDLVEKHRDTLGNEYPQLQAQLKTRVQHAQALGTVDYAMAGVAQNMANPPAPDNTAVLREAVYAQESGNGRTDPGNPGQIQRDTFDRYARPGETWGDPAAMRTVANRYFDDVTKAASVDGKVDPGRVAVGYFSGIGNIAPAGAATPWKVDASDKNGKTTSSYVADIQGRLGAKGPMLAARADVYDKVLAATEGHPEVRQEALTEVNRRFQAAEVADLADQKAAKARSDATLRGYGDVIRAGKGGEMPWRNDPSLTEEQVEHLDTLAKTSLKEAIEGTPGDWGPGAGGVLSRIFSNGPDRIRNEEQLLSLAADGTINPAGYHELSAKLKEANAPGAEADRVLQSNFYKQAERAVTLESEMTPGFKRPGGAEQWNKALPVLTQAIGALRAKGLTNAQIMDPDNKDSVWTALKPFLPSQAEAAAASARDHVLSDAADAAKKAAAEAQVDLTTVKTADDAAQLLHARKITRAQAAELVRSHPEWNVRPPETPSANLPAGYSGPDVRDLVAAPGSAATDQTAWDKRGDGSAKGTGFLGVLRRPDGGVSSEMSVGVTFDGKETDIPVLVPTLTRAEVETVLKTDPKNGKLPPTIVEKAAAFARKRLAAGKSPFAAPNETPDWAAPAVPLR